MECDEETMQFSNTKISGEFTLKKIGNNNLSSNYGVAKRHFDLIIKKF